MSLPKLFERIFWHNNTTPAVNETNLNAMSKGLSDVDDRLISLGGLIMETVPEIQQDMEILGPAVESIDDNVAAAQASAETAEEQALKSEGFAVGEQDGVPVGSDSEYFENNAEYFANIANPPIRVIKDFAPIISITDAINKKARDVKIKVEPVQNLHGYTKPWPGGAGKNVLQLTVADLKAANLGGTWSGNVYTINGVAHTVQFDADGNVTGFDVHGTASGYTFLNINIPKYDKNVQYKLVVTGATSAFTSQVSYQATQGADSIYLASITGANTATFTMPNADVYSMRSRFYMISGGSANHVKIKIMVCKATESSDFESYTNNCPITGHSEAKLTRSGVNLFNGILTNGIKNSDGTYTPGTTTRVTNATAEITNTLKIAAGKYTISSETLDYCTVIVCDAFGNQIDNYARQWYAFPLTFTASNDGYLYFSARKSDNSNIGTSQKIKVEKGEVATPFDGYSSEVFTINLGDTRYGCVLDVDAGTLTVNKIYKEFTSTDSLTWYRNNAGFIYTAWTKVGKTNTEYGLSGICSNYAVSTVGRDCANGECKINTTVVTSTSDCIILKDDRFPSAEDFKASLTTPLQIVYELATPQTIQLTPQEIDLLFGNNTLFADTGDIYLEYDASGIIHIAEAKLDIDVFKAVTAASSDFADFKSRVAAL